MRPNRLWKLTLVFLMLAALCLPDTGLSADSDAAADAEVSFPEVLSPEEGEAVPREGEDPACGAAAACPRVYVRGRVPAGLHPFLAVAPLNAAPRIWIQPPVIAVKRDRTFMGMVYLGTEKVGAGEKYQLLVLAHVDSERFREGQVLTEVPDDVVASDPVTVLRTR